MLVANDWTPTQRRILSLLSDGRGHTVDEIKKCLNDDMALPGTVSIHLFEIRKKLKPTGHSILCERNGKASTYRQVRSIDTSE